MPGPEQTLSSFPLIEKAILIILNQVPQKEA